MRILIVEDESTLVTYLKKSLEAEGYTVDAALDGDTGLELALSGSYDAITLDIMLPGMNGYSVCREIRKAGISTPVLMLTAKDGEYDEAERRAALNCVWGIWCSTPRKGPSLVREPLSSSLRGNFLFWNT